MARIEAGYVPSTRLRAVLNNVTYIYPNCITAEMQGVPTLLYISNKLIRQTSYGARGVRAKEILSENMSKGIFITLYDYRVLYCQLP